MTERSARWAFPLLEAGQAQKELFHNEAVATIDLIVQAVVDSVGRDVPPESPEPGACWVVGDSPEGAWSAAAGHLAGWTEGGWRFVKPAEGMTVWATDRAVPARYREGAWVIGAIEGDRLVIGGEQVVGARGVAIAEPAGGSVIDAEARTAIDAILTMARAHGLIESS